MKQSIEKVICKDIQSFTESFEKGLRKIEKGYVIAQCTDRIMIQKVCGEKLDRDGLFRRAIDLRIFDANGEIKWFRSSIDKNLVFRERMQDNELYKDIDYWDEEQYLDIDTNKSNRLPEGRVAATGGGEYELPLSDFRDIKIKIRNYIDYEKDTGRMYIYDWRAVDFIKKEEGINGKI